MVLYCIETSCNTTFRVAASFPIIWATDPERVTDQPQLLPTEHEHDARPRVRCPHRGVSHGPVVDLRWECAWGGDLAASRVVSLSLSLSVVHGAGETV